MVNAEVKKSQADSKYNFRRSPSCLLAASPETRSTGVSIMVEARLEECLVK